MNTFLSKIEEKLKSGDWYRLVFLGDSITSTEWVHPNWREIVEYVLKMELERRMGEWEAPNWKIRAYNAGYNGVRTKEMLDFIDEDVALHQPDMIIFMDTYNDKYRNISPSEHEENLVLIFDKLTKIASDVCFTTSCSNLHRSANETEVPYIEAGQRAVAQFADQITTVDVFSEFAEYDVSRFFTFIEEGGNEDAGIEPGDIDFSHPNPLGNAVIAKIILKEIFDIDFNPDTYIRDTLAGVKYPRY